MLNKIKHILLPFLLLSTIDSCTYVKALPQFPEVKILKIYIPFSIEPNEEAEWTVWANSPAESLYVDTYYKGFIENSNKILLGQKSSFIYGQAPVSGIQGTWNASHAGRYELRFRAWNKWDEDIVYRFIDVETTTLYEY